MLLLALTPAALIFRKDLWRSRFWQAVGCAHLMWGIGQVLWIASQQPGLATELQDSMYWLYKLFILGAILYRPFYRGSDLNRRLHFLDTVVAVSIIGYYIGYFFLLPAMIAGHTAQTFYNSLANVLMNTGIAATAIVLAWKARPSEWATSYRMIAIGLASYTGASLTYVLFKEGFPDYFWCGAFWSMAVAVMSAPPKGARTIDTAIVPYRYGLSMLLIAPVSVFHLAMTWFANSPREVLQGRDLLTLAEILILTALAYYRHRSTVHESELRSQQLDVTVNTLRQPVYIVDGHYNIVLANDVFHRRFPADGLCYASVFGRSEPCDGCELQANRGFSRSVNLGESIYQLEFAPLPASDGKGGVELLVDVTIERKRQQQAIQTERMASLGRMIAGTAHELNNPLAIVLGNAQLLRDESGLGDEGRQMVESIASAGERARDIVHTFLTLSRPRESGKEIVDLVSVIQSVEHLKDAELRSYGIGLHMDLPPSLPLMGRYTVLQEIFLNLIDNARDAIREAKRQPGSIRISGRMNGDRIIHVEIQDNGTGIRKDDLDRVFDPFFSTKEVGQGTGLGLSVVHSIVTDHGGTIQVASDGNSFTRFRMEFPTSTADTDISRAPVGTGNLLRILVVDDEPEMLSVLKQSLSRLGHHVECTSTGARALQLLSKNKFDVMLLDMHLPEMDGKTIVRRLEAMTPPVSVRAIVVTGDTISGDIASFAEEHHLPVVMKPVDFDRLNLLLQETVTVEDAH
jgi:signal transduction histidine kinase/CheY-like chemotaxis protein